MDIFDISREFFSAPPYGGDPAPQQRRLQDVADDAEYTLSVYSASAHASTHADAPLHYILGGEDAEEVSLSPFVGGCTVASYTGEMTGAQAEALLSGIKERRVLLKGFGNAFLSQSAAFAFASEGIRLVGTDAPSIGRGNQEDRAHRELLGAGIPILENLNLDGVEPGNYFLVAAPVKMAGLEAAPVRALLLRGISVYE